MSCEILDMTDTNMYRVAVSFLWTKDAMNDNRQELKPVPSIKIAIPVGGQKTFK
jgi:hypothetical protein